MNYPVSSTNALPRNNKDGEWEEEFRIKTNTRDQSTQGMWPYLSLIFKKNIFF